MKAIVGTLEALRGFADFSKPEPGPEPTRNTDKLLKTQRKNDSEDATGGAEEVRLNLAYTINLVLPKTDDIAVFNAIFKSLRENLLKK